MEMPDKEPNRRVFISRNPDLIRREELLQAAKWWAINATTMPPGDPWKSHMALLPLAALLCASARELATWLETADRAVGGGLKQTIYADARLELIAESPPWFHKEFMASHDSEAFRYIARAELANLIEDIRGDALVTGGRQ